MEIMDGVPVLQITGEALALVNRIAEADVLPAKATLDVLRISIAAVHGMAYLATWSCKDSGERTL